MNFSNSNGGVLEITLKSASLQDDTEAKISSSLLCTSGHTQKSVDKTYTLSSHVCILFGC